MATLAATAVESIGNRVGFKNITARHFGPFINFLDQRFDSTISNFN